MLTIDAMGCQKDIASEMIDKESNYILGLKRNQGNLLEQTENSFRFLHVSSTSEEMDAGHGRVERRICPVVDDWSMTEKKEDWKNLQCPVKIQAERYVKSTGKTENETRFYISSLPADATLFNGAIRSHWGIENSLHRILNVAFNEDNNRKRAGNAAQNFSAMNRIALNLLKNELTTKRGVKEKSLG